MSYRASAVFVFVAVFASCEAQQLELVPEEPSLSETVDSGASGGSTATGGRTNSGGVTVSTGGNPLAGGKSGAGGGPSSGGSFAGTGGFPGPIRTCQRKDDCEFGDCENSVCVACTFSGCKEGLACNQITGRCETYCSDGNDCTDPFASECNTNRHLCVECLINDDCKGSSTDHVCDKRTGVCVECVEAKDCGTGNFRCAPGGDCRCVDDTACAPGRCDPNSRECVDRP